MHVYILQDFDNTKLGLLETCNETWFDQIMLSMPQRFSAFNSCHNYNKNVPQQRSKKEFNYFMKSI